MTLQYSVWVAFSVLARPIMLGILAVNSALLIADIIRRRLLSRAFIWYFTMLAEPAAIAVCIGLLIGRPILYAGEELKEWAGFLLDILIASAAVTTALIILVRGHIRVIDKRLPKYADLGAEALRAVSIKRLIAAGAWGTIISALFFAFITFVQLPAFTLMGLTFLLGLLCPLFIMVSFVSMLMAGMELISLGVLLLIVIIEYLPVVNGCLRYIFTETKASKGIKALLTVLCVVFPPFGVIYGFCALGDLKRRYEI